MHWIFNQLDSLTDDESDTRKILKALKAEISNMEARFDSRGDGNGIDFKLEKKEEK